jgi:hypothetical protein
MVQRRGHRVRGPEKTQRLRAVLDEDPLVVADAVLDGVNQAVGHGPPRLLVEGDRSQVLDPRVQLEVRVAAGGDHRLALRKQVPAEAHVLVVWLDEQVDEMVSAYRDMADRRTIDDGYARLELGFGQEPIVELLPGARWVGGFQPTGEQLRRVRLREAAVVIVRDCTGVSGGRRANLERIHVSMLTHRRRAAGGSCTQISSCPHSEDPLVERDVGAERSAHNVHLIGPPGPSPSAGAVLVLAVDVLHRDSTRVGAGVLEVMQERDTHGLVLAHEALRFAEGDEP